LIIKGHQRTIGLDLGDRWSFYCKFRESVFIRVDWIWELALLTLQLCSKFSRRMFMFSRQDNPFHHSREACLIICANRLELKTQASPHLNVPYFGVGPDSTVFDKEMKFNGRINGTDP
jgi:hypothetical protein